LILNPEFQLEAGIVTTDNNSSGKILAIVAIENALLICGPVFS